jgi:hypothetical protein
LFGRRAGARVVKSPNLDAEPGCFPERSIKTVHAADRYIFWTLGDRRRMQNNSKQTNSRIRPHFAKLSAVSTYATSVERRSIAAVDDSALGTTFLLKRKNNAAAAGATRSTKHRPTWPFGGREVPIDCHQKTIRHLQLSLQPRHPPKG